ncbi:RagB/SusD family nutrient uptake outer membrane protein [Sphingobacterium bambusae]|uniref:RagB/SusD family nutrient uptake outer membrane protein n=1 Tax=Sphingobacterium bambusae TaxID=662858 RepID=A0ABW6BBX4_9SPHI|nr:RagB/SusD family nutrient uptake outer membrane protein [Sphingobacterium bambusae]WPL47094.1 RagB/SusD family nutrient uptake outer membrane protein [Sphingobacterium bambusae]
MKINYKNIFFALATSVTLWSCGDKLNIEPEQSIREEVALNSDENVKRALSGAYNELSEEYFYGGVVQLLSELLTSTSEIRWEGTFSQPREVYNKNMLATNSFVTNLWLQGYDAINIANNVLGALTIVNEEDRDVVEGQALFVRGIAHFELVRLFAKPYSSGSISSNPGVPLKLTATREIDEESYLPRASVEEVYTQIINDLTTAESLLENSGEFAYGQKTAAAAILSRVYLQMENYAEARDAANRAIDYGRFAVGSSYARTFNSGKINSTDPDAVSSDGIFQMPVSAQDGANVMHTYWSITAYGARAGDVVVLPAHLALYDQSVDAGGAYLDHRLALFYRGEGNDIGTGDWRSGKWKFLNSNLSIVRLSEMYLTRAECNFRLGTSVGATALADINYIRERHTALPNLTTVDLNRILLERRLELAHEGQGIHDIKRLKGSVDGTAYDDRSLLLPIPQREIDASNGVLVQN